VIAGRDFINYTITHRQSQNVTPEDGVVVDCGPVGLFGLLSGTKHTCVCYVFAQAEDHQRFGDGINKGRDCNEDERPQRHDPFKPERVVFVHQITTSSGSANESLPVSTFCLPIMLTESEFATPVVDGFEMVVIGPALDR